MGIGEQLVYKFIEQGCLVTILDKNKNALEQIPKKLKNLNFQYGNQKFQKIEAQYQLFECDITRHDQVKTIIQEAQNKFGKIQILVNNAGVVFPDNIKQKSIEQFNLTMDINFNAPVRIIKEILPQMMENDNGHIVNIASVLGYIGCCGISDYCASKSALVGFEESVRFELFKANSNVKMTSICPYLINTQLFEGVQPKKWFEILVPKLDQKYVAQRILNAIRQNERVVILPYIMYIILAVKPLLPSWLHEIIQDLSGSNEVMDHLKIKKKQ